MQTANHHPNFLGAQGKEHSLCRQDKSSQGIALILVLAIIVLVAMLVIGFLTLATSERRASSTYAQNAETRLLAENTVDIVMGQIRAATTNLGNTKTWASQPGMIRVYGTTTGSAGLAALDSAYKLYSSGTMVVSGSSFDASADYQALGGGTWASSPAIYTDLNQPVTSSNGELVYPIIDGSGLNTSGSTTYTGTNNSNGLSGQAIQGFYINNAPTAAASGTANPVPMPVQWLYQLKDGTLIAPDVGSSGTTASFENSVEKPSPNNPIVGRIAFWTDDETCKVNINTASEGTFWDTPYANTKMERGTSVSPATGTGSLTGTVASPYGFASSYPVFGEYNRYPGHPATTSLSAVLGNWLPINATDQWNNNPQTYLQEITPYWGLTPRIYNGFNGTPQGGTLGGTVASTSTASTTNTTGITQAVNDADRLYATVDELYYASATDGTGREVNNSEITPDVLQKAKFFLTANSRAPEVTLFNTPRMSLWPIMFGTKFRTPEDQLLAFCSSIGTGTAALPYYFQRYSPTYYTGGPSGTYGSAYLSATSSASDFNTGNSAGARNIQLYQYMQALTSSNIPGFGGNFLTKYGADRDQILTEAFDYIRSNVNLIPPIYPTGSAPNGFANYVYTYGGAYYYYNENQIIINDSDNFYDQNYCRAGSYCVIPLQPTNNQPGAGTKGFGRMATITKAALILWDADNYTMATSATNLETTGSFAKNYSKPASQVQAFLAFQFFTPTAQNAPQLGGMRIRVQGLDQFKVTGNNGAQSLNLPPDASMVLSTDTRWDTGGADGCAEMPVEVLFQWLRSPFTTTPTGNRSERTLGSTALGTTSEMTNYPFYSSSSALLAASVSGTVPVAAGPPTMAFTGGTMTVTIYNPTNTSGTDGHGDTVQTLQMVFPNATWPTPRLPTQSVLPSYLSSNKNANPLGGFVIFNSLSERFYKIWWEYDKPEIWQNYYPREFLFPTSGSIGISVGSSVSLSDLGAQTLGIAYGDDRLLVISPGDVARDVEVNPNASFGGDYRLYFATGTISADQFQPCASYSDSNVYNAATLRSDKFMSMGEYGYAPGSNMATGTTDDVLTGEAWRPSSISTAGSLITDPNTGQPLHYTPWAVPNVPVRLTAATMKGTANGRPGDWETGVGMLPDGPYVRVPDIHLSGGNTLGGDLVGIAGGGGYYQLGMGFPVSYSTINLTPSRQIASAVQLGALPTGVKAAHPWQTLLFCPNPAGRQTPAETPPTPNDHEGFAFPQDHLFLDLFWMPVVEPYAISEPLSTAGKVNMNYQIQPFTYIKRETAVDAVMKNVLIRAIPPSAVTAKTRNPYKTYSYKEWDQCPYEFLYQINLDDQNGTLRGFEDRFNSGDIFRSASEICDIFLVPYNQDFKNKLSVKYAPDAPDPSDYSDMVNWWQKMTATGDNLREDPYNQIYPRLTTKSNSYRVYVRVQALRQVPSDQNAGTWTEGKSQVVGEYRGSYLLERYIDPNDPNLPDFAKNLNSYATSGNLPSGDSPQTSVDDYYRFRVLERKQFAP